METLKEIGLRIPNHSKTESHIEDYLPTYEWYFSPRRNDPLKMLEIGIGRGGSPRIWREYFPKGEIYGADFFRDKFYTEDRIQANFWCDQHDPSTLIEMMEKIGPCDIIIDDGSHSCDAQINSLVYLYNYVKSGGLYIIEDCHTAYFGQFGGGYGKYNILEFVKPLLDNVNAIHATRNSPWTDREYNDRMKMANPYDGCPVPEPIENFNKTIKFIHVYDSLLIFGKK